MELKQNIDIKTNQINATVIDYSLRPNQPNPRCLAVLPNNVEELIHQFKMQGKGLCLDSQPYFLPETKSTD